MQCQMPIARGLGVLHLLWQAIWQDGGQRGELDHC